MKTHLSKHLWLLLWLLFAGSTIPSITWGYDAQPGHLSTGYGLHPALATDYDSAVVPTIGRETSPTAEIRRDAGRGRVGGDGAGKPDEGHSLPLQVKLFANLTKEDKLKMRAEASLLCPQIVGSSRNRTKYIDPIMYLLTYHGILASRDAFSAGSAAGPERGGIYVKRALMNVQHQMIQAAHYLEGALFIEYWGRNVLPERRLKEWLKMADVYAKVANPAWTPSKVLFLEDKDRP